MDDHRTSVVLEAQEAPVSRMKCVQVTNGNPTICYLNIVLRTYHKLDPRVCRAKLIHLLSDSLKPM